MNTKTKILSALAITLLLFSLSSPVNAEEVAVSISSRSILINELFGKAVSPVAPLIKQNQVSVRLAQTNVFIPTEDPKKLEKRFFGLLLNAVSNAPKSGEIIIGFEKQTASLYINVPKKSERFSIDRDITDVNGNIFHIKSVEGVGTTYSMKI
ncbi:MAG: hypothetical protein K8T10_21770 [Candidatus Eremiobacteraeota bacterium]|nr:hypothetical protein [Candidatus Eremiobacteraeota bacterium]